MALQLRMGEVIARGVLVPLRDGQQFSLSEQLPNERRMLARLLSPGATQLSQFAINRGSILHRDGLG